MVWLPDDEKNSKISLFVFAQLTNVTDRQTDTASRHMHMHRAVKSDLCKDVLTVCAQLKITPNIENILTNVEIIDVIFRNISRKI